MRRSWPSVSGRTASAARGADRATPDRCPARRLRECAVVADTRSRRRRGPCSTGPGPSVAGGPARRSSRPDRTPSRLDRRTSRPVVSPTYAQGSCYGTNRVVAGAPGRLTGPAAPLLSTARATQPPGRDPSRLGSSVPRTGRVFRKNGMGAWYEGAGRLASDRGFEHVPALAPDRRSTRRADGDGDVRSRIVTGELH